MNFKCPYCGSKKKPLYMSGSPPFLLKCPKCSKMAHERVFFLEEGRTAIRSVPIP